MPRPPRCFENGLAYHVINRGNRRSRVFHCPEDYEDFLSAMAVAAERTTVCHCTFCLMSNHFHIVVRPKEATDLSRYMQILMNRHLPRVQRRHGTRGTGHVYQDRYKCLPIEGDDHFLRVCRYVDANPVRAGLVNRAEDYRWSGLSCHATKDGRALLSEWPVPRPANWLELVNIQLGEDELKPIRKAIERTLRKRNRVPDVGDDVL